MAQEDSQTAGLKVLVVDDTATNRQLLQIFLKRLGCTVLLAEDGAQALEVFEREAPDLVFMDVMMPVMDGYEATRRIKAMTPGRWVPVVFLSALDKDENLVAGLEAGGDDYLAKPVNFVVLNAKLRSLSRTLNLQRNLDEALRRSKAVSENIADGVITIDSESRIQSVNPAVDQIFGYEPGELIGQNVSILMPNPHRRDHDAYVSKYVHGGPPNIIGIGQRQVPGQRKDGSIVPLELGVTEMRFNGERLFVGIIRDVSERANAERKLREHADALQHYHDEREAENALAGGIMHRLMLRRSLADKALHFWVSPASDFSGDMIAGARAADGRLYAMLADATGHGLAAAISVVPVLTSFYTLAEQGYPLGFIAYELNRQLMAYMPTSRFVAASLICLDPQTGVAEAWLGGMPDLLLLGPEGGVLRQMPSRHLALGIAEFDESEAGIERIECPPGSQLVLFSDGLVEAGDRDGHPFGTERLMAALIDAPAGQRLESVQAALQRHGGTDHGHDDISLLLVDC